MSDSTKLDKENSTWVTLAIPASPAAMALFLKSIERLFRLNPYLDIKQWDVLAEDRFHLTALNEMNGISYDLELALESQEDMHYLLRYSQGLKQALEVSVEAGSDPSSAVLTLREYYFKSESALDEQQLKEIDHSLIPWGNSIHTYVKGMRRWSWFWPYRWYREKFWLGMRPTHRRIARLIGWVTLLEFVVFLFVFVIYWLELARKMG